MAVAFPSSRVRRFPWVDKAVQTAKTWLSPAKPAISNLASVPMFVAGVGLIDFGIFHWSHALGWIASGASLIILERIASDE